MKNYIFFCYHDIGAKYPPTLPITNFSRETWLATFSEVSPLNHIFSSTILEFETLSYNYISMNNFLLSVIFCLIQLTKNTKCLLYFPKKKSLYSFFLWENSSKVSLYLKWPNKCISTFDLTKCTAIYQPTKWSKDELLA